MMTMAMLGAPSRSPLPDVNMLSFCMCSNDANTTVMYICISIVLVFHSQVPFYLLRFGSFIQIVPLDDGTVIRVRRLCQ